MVDRVRRTTASMYNVSEACGSVVPALAHNKRCGLALAAASLRQRSETSWGVRLQLEY
jgi:hypothetical protein